MSLIERYVLKTTTLASIAGLFALTGVIWITQALRQIDLLTSKGQTLLIFLLMTGLALPSLIGIIAPIALFSGVLYTLNKMNGDSKLVVMASAGVSPARLLRPFVIVSTAVLALVGTIYIQILPWSFGALQNLTSFVQADFISNFAHPGAFSNLQFGFVFHYRERTPDGALRGVFMQDRRDPAHVSTYIAEAGKTFEKDGESFLQLSKGVLLRPQSAGDSAIVSFDDYTIDLSQFMVALNSVKRPRERSTLDLMKPDPKSRPIRRCPGTSGASCWIVSQAPSMRWLRASSVSRPSGSRARPGRGGDSRSAARLSSSWWFECSASRPRP